jgi:hypothetical protein
MFISCNIIIKIKYHCAYAKIKVVNMVEKDSKLVKTLAVLVVVVIIATIAAAVLLNEEAAGDDKKVAGSQIDAMAMLGEEGWEGLTAVALAEDGSIYALGWVNSPTNITTAGAFDQTCGGNDELILVKYTADLGTLLVCTYLGGDGNDRGQEIAVGPDGYVYVAGGTTSTDFPVTDGAANTSGPEGLGGDVWTNFVCRLSPDLSGITACTFVGGQVDDPNCDLDFTPSGDIIVGGQVEEVGMNATEGAFTESRPGSLDIYVSVISSDLSSIEAFTFLGGSERDYLYDIAVDPQGDIYLACSTTRKLVDPVTPFPITEGAYQSEAASPGFGGNIEGIVARLSGDLTELEASTYFGTDDSDSILGITMHPDGSVVICGTTQGELPTTEGAYQRARLTSIQSFVAKLDSDLTELRACTYIGTGTSYILSIACDEDGRIYLHGMTSSFPTTEGAIRETYGGWNSDMFIAQLSSDLSFLRSSTYLGGNYDEGDGYGMVVTANGTAYVAGWTTSTNFPAEGIGHANADYSDGFVVKISFG